MQLMELQAALPALGPSVENQDPLLFKRFMFMAKIGESEEIVDELYEGQNRWLYTLQPGYVSGLPADFTFTDFGPTVRGINTYELDNTSLQVQGVSLEDLPDGFAFGPAVGYVNCWPSRMAEEVEVEVDGEMETQTHLRQTWFFCVPLTVDGECEE